MYVYVLTINEVLNAGELFIYQLIIHWRSEGYSVEFFARFWVLDTKASVDLFGEVTGVITEGRDGMIFSSLPTENIPLFCSKSIPFSVNIILCLKIQ